jgi:cytoskeletal protein RodZ
MKEKDEELDKLFRKGAGDPANEPVYREADWEAMEQLLDQRKKRGGIVYWLPRLGSVAAVLLLSLLAWLLFRPHPVKQSNDQQVASVHSKPDTGISSAAARHETADSSKQKIHTPANLAQNSDHPGEGKKTDRSFPYLPEGHAAKTPGKSSTNVFVNNNAPVSKDNEETGTAALKNNDSTNVLAANADKTNAGQTAAQTADGNVNAPANNTALAHDKGNIAQTGIQQDNGNTKGLANNGSKPKAKAASVSGGASHAIFAITAIASSDMNGISPLNSGRLGGNFGGLLSVSYGKWTLSTGGMYSIKPYQESFADYHSPYKFQTTPASVGANCRMIDIPLNLNYQVYRKGANKFTVGTGLSSYIILREDYSFNYANTYYSGPASYSVVNRNRNVMSILNLDVTYEHQINPRFGLILQPYYKLPLTNVGFSQVKLQSTGLAVGLNMNLNPFKKPN